MRSFAELMYLPCEDPSGMSLSSLARLGAKYRLDENSRLHTRFLCTSHLHLEVMGH